MGLPIVGGLIASVIGILTGTASRHRPPVARAPPLPRSPRLNSTIPSRATTNSLAGALEREDSHAQYSWWPRGLRRWHHQRRYKRHRPAGAGTPSLPRSPCLNEPFGMTSQVQQPPCRSPDTSPHTTVVMVAERGEGRPARADT